MSAAPDLDWHDVEDAQPAATVNGHHRLDDVPHDLDAESAVLGAAILAPGLIPELSEAVGDHDWYLPAHETIWCTLVDLAATGQAVDPITVATAVGTDRALAGHGGPLYINQLTTQAGLTISNAVWHARIVATKAAERRTVALGTWLVQAGRSGTDPALIAARIEQHHAQRGPAASFEIGTLDDLLEEDEDDEPAWIVPDLLERGDRCILTAGEGTGKSTLLRQIAIMCGAGIHPFRGTPMPPINVMVVDLENSKRQSRRKTRAMRIKVGKQLERDRVRFEVRLQGLDLTTPADVTWLSNAVGRYKPDLLITGPVYKLASGNPNDEESAKPVALAIDRIREEHDVAVLLEAHSAKAPAGQKRRPMEPYGWSGWMRWPEFGIHLADDGTLSHWRGQRDERDWPDLLLKGGPWPWMPAQQGTPDERWAQIHSCLTAAGERLSNREIARRTGIAESSVRVLLARNSRRLAALLDHLGVDDDE